MQETYWGFVHDMRLRALRKCSACCSTATVPSFTARRARTALVLLLRSSCWRWRAARHGRGGLPAHQRPYRRPEGLASLAPSEVLAVLWRVQEDFLDAALHRVDADYGGIDTYLVDVLGLDTAARKELAQRYLQAFVTLGCTPLRRDSRPKKEVYRHPPHRRRVPCKSSPTCSLTAAAKRR